MFGVEEVNVFYFPFATCIEKDWYVSILQFWMWKPNLTSLIYKSYKGWQLAIWLSNHSGSAEETICLCRSTLGFPFIFISDLRDIWSIFLACLLFLLDLVGAQMLILGPRWPLVGRKPKTHFPKQAVELLMKWNLYSPFWLLNLSDSRFLNWLTPPIQ